MERYLKACIKEDLQEKMVFLGGPRQVGKTTLSISFLTPPSIKNPAYLSWDVPAVRKQLLNGALPPEQKLIILDEIHKYKQWRGLVKGLYDTEKEQRSFLITGSARLDYYRRGGDSLQGRYHYLRLHPLSPMELKTVSTEDIKILLKFGGFPEPFFKQSERLWRRWQRERVSRVLQEDLISLETVKDMSSMTILANLLPDRVGGVLSIKALAEDLQVAFETADRWLSILENLYHCYRLAPFTAKKLRALKKEKKLFLWDWSACPTDGARFENLVASLLLKYAHFLEDTEGFDMSLRYLRDSDKREIDFVLLQDNKPLFAVECKYGEKGLSPHIPYFAERTAIPQFFQVHLGSKDVEIRAHRTRILPLGKFCELVGLV